MLNGYEIWYESIAKKLIEPPIEENIQPASYDLTLGNKFLELNPIYKGKVISPKNKYTLKNEYVELKPNLNGDVILPPLSFCLATTKEYVRVPTDLVGIVTGRSSLARLGLFVHITAGFIDSGFEGNITLELFNCSENPIVISDIDRIAQIYFLELNQETFAYDGKYQNQINTTPTRIYKDYEDNEG